MSGLYSLIGMPACGKSTLGAQLAEKLKIPFIDSDAYIVSKEGLSISEIFQNFGEPHFRQLELSTIIEILNTTQSAVLSLGGGSVVLPDMMKTLNQKTTSIFISISAQEWLKRVWMSQKMKESPKYGIMNREELAKYFENTLKDRLPFYERANYTLNISDGESIHESFNSLLKII